MIDKLEADMGQKIVVTGGAGFIGSHIVDTFVRAGHDVAVIDNLHTGQLSNLNPMARFYRVDIRDAEAVESVFAIEKPDVVAHEAALADVRASLADPVAYAQVNIVGMLNILEAARRNGTRKILFASTGGAVYGEAQEVPTSEACPTHPLDPYGISKLAGEHYLYGYYRAYGLAYCALRYANVYGPRQDSYGEAGVVAIFAGRMLRGEQVVINGGGKQQRDFVYVSDIASANLLALEHGQGIYNLGSGSGTEINTLFREVARLADSTLDEIHGPAKPGEVYRSCLNAERAGRELGWTPATPLRSGLALTVASLQATLAPLVTDLQASALD
jgi:UDP-glucose 4-epimerase